MTVAISREDPKVVRAFVKKTPFPFPVLLDPGSKVASAYGVVAIPVTCAVDPQGRVVKTMQGFIEGAFWDDFAPAAQKLLVH